MARTTRNGGAGGAPFLLQGFDYGTNDDVGVACGSGWSLPEIDENQHLFRWVGPHARTLLHAPDLIQKNGDQRLLALRIYSLRVRRTQG